MFYRFLSLTFIFVVLCSDGGCGDSETKIVTDEFEATPDDTMVQEPVVSPGEFDFERADKIVAVETKSINWKMVPDAEKIVRTTTGKIVYQTAEGRLIISHYEDGSPRFAIRQFDPQIFEKSSPKSWITNGVHQAWLRDGTHIRFFADDMIPYGTWVLTDNDGEFRAEIAFENFEHTGELRSAMFPTPGGGRPAFATYDSDKGEWSFKPAGMEDRVSEVEKAVKLVKEFLNIVSQIP